MTVGHDEIHLRRSTPSDVLKDADPTLFALLGTGSQCQHLFVSSQIHVKAR